ncbi:hypothetical protein J1614_010301 [Plenodomus biglobosus]|nr:hypothetical protein J1614_010301 [Plenodomus biglobosus]
MNQAFDVVVNVPVDSVECATSHKLGAGQQSFTCRRGEAQVVSCPHGPSSHSLQTPESALVININAYLHTVGGYLPVEGPQMVYSAQQMRDA